MAQNIRTYKYWQNLEEKRSYVEEFKKLLKKYQSYEYRELRQSLSLLGKIYKAIVAFITLLGAIIPVYQFLKPLLDSKFNIKLP